MKVIELTKGRVAIVDDEDFEWLAQWRWNYTASGNRKGYAHRMTYFEGKGFHVMMHREIMAPIPKGFEVDHVNGDTLDNRRCNLRIGTHTQNAYNRPKNKNNTTGHKGAYRSRYCFTARIKANGKDRYLGCFPTLEEAKAAYDKAALELHGAYARLN